MAVFYVTEQGSSIHKTSKRLIVVKDENPIQVMRIHEIERIIIFGNIQITTQAMAFMLDQGIDVSLMSEDGRFRGRLTPPDSKNIPLRMSHYDRYHDESFRISIARKVIANKIKNSRSILLKYSYNHPEIDIKKEIDHLEASAKSLENHADISALMGVEGESAASYFRAYGRMFRRELQFSERSRRPPKDPINALLSLGYMMLTNEMTSMISAHGLDVHIGFLHEIDYGRPSLALDMIEEFRQPIVDRFVLSLANRLVFTERDFDYRGEDGVYLQKESCKRYFELYDRMMTTTFKNRTSNEEVSFRLLFRRQAQQMTKCILENQDYEPFLLTWPLI